MNKEATNIAGGYGNLALSLAELHRLSFLLRPILKALQLATFYRITEHDDGLDVFLDHHGPEGELRTFQRPLSTYEALFALRSGQIVRMNLNTVGLRYVIFAQYVVAVQPGMFEDDALLILTRYIHIAVLLLVSHTGVRCHGIRLPFGQGTELVDGIFNALIQDTNNPFL